MSDKPKQDRPKFLDRVNVYEFNCKLPGSNQEVIFKPVNTGQLKKLLTYENETNLLIQEQALDDLISSSVLSEDFNIDELYLEDRFFLLVELRKKTKGEVLEFTLTCPKCKSQTLNRVDLNKLKVKPLDPGASKVVELSNDIKVHLRRLKRKHQKEIRPGMIKQHLTPMQQQAEIQILFHACAIDKVESPDGVDENIQLKDRKYLVETIPTGEYDKIRDGLEALTFGVDLSYKVGCNACKYSQTVDVPIENNFFS